jgi:hypothetical protein
VRSNSSKFDVPVHKCKERVVFANAYIIARMKVSAALPHNDVAGAHGLAAKLFHTQTSACAVSAIL